MVAGEGLSLNDDLVAVRGGFVKARHEQVEVGGQGLHDDDFGGQGTHNLGGLVLEGIVEVQPGRVSAFQGLKVAKDALGGPRVQVAVHILAGAAGLQAQRIATQIYRLVVVVWSGGGVAGPVSLVAQVGLCRNDKLGAQLAQGVPGVLAAGKGLGREIAVVDAGIRVLVGGHGGEGGSRVWRGCLLREDCSHVKASQLKHAQDETAFGFWLAGRRCCSEPAQPSAGCEPLSSSRPAGIRQRRRWPARPARPAQVGWSATRPRELPRLLPS